MSVYKVKPFLGDGGSGGGSAGYGSNYFISNYDFLDLVNGKHLDVDKLISLFDNSGVSLDGNIMESSGVKILPRAMRIDSGEENPFINVKYDSCLGGIRFVLGRNLIELTESAETFRELFLANKTVIEDTTIDYSFMSGYSDFYDWMLDNGGSSYPVVRLSDFMQCLK